MIDQITPLLITFDEAPNIERVLGKLRWARRILVVDSGSTDGTLEILGQHPSVAVFHRPFDSAAAQCNFGLGQIETEWALSLDADYELSDALVGELRELDDLDGVCGYRARFVYRVAGRALRGTLYPPRTVLYRRRSSRYIDEGHTQRIVVSGKVGTLLNPIFHDDRKPLARWFASQRRYAGLEASYLSAMPAERLSRASRVRLMALPAPFLVFIYVLIVKGCIFDGWPGWFYALQRFLAETMLALELIDRRFERATEGGQLMGSVRPSGGLDEPLG